MSLIYGIYRKIPGKKKIKEMLPSGMKKLLIQVLTIFNKGAEWPLLLANIYLKEGNKKLAAKNTQKAMRIIQSSYVLKRKGGYLQKIEFELNKILYQMGEPMAEDPLIESSCEEVVNENNIIYNADGKFTLLFEYNGLKVSGNVYCNRRNAFIEILLDGQIARKIPLRFENEYAKFDYKIKRPVLDLFPKKTTIQVRLDDGKMLGYKNCKKSGYVKIPHGDGSLLYHIEKYGGLDKKGHIKKSKVEMEAVQHMYLKIYDAVKVDFKKVTGVDLFLLYGTLLGQYRDHEFIPGDDDFDVGYVSYNNTPKQVKEETKKIILDLINKGYTVTMNKRGKPFRLHHKGISENLHLDVRPVWEQEGKIWAHKQACLQLNLKDFANVEKKKLKGVDVLIPEGTLAFLRAYYGAKWMVPDPNFSNASIKVDRHVKQNIELSCFTTFELNELISEVNRIKKRTKNAGNFFASGMHSLYPLHLYQQNCGW